MPLNSTWSDSFSLGSAEEHPFYTIYDIFDDTSSSNGGTAGGVGGATNPTQRSFSSAPSAANSGVVDERKEPLVKEFRRMFVDKRHGQILSSPTDGGGRSVNSRNASPTRWRAEEMFEGALALPSRRLQLFAITAAASAVPHCHVLVVTEDGALSRPPTAPPMNLHVVLSDDDIPLSGERNERSNMNMSSSMMTAADHRTNTYYHLVSYVLCGSSAAASGNFVADTPWDNDLKKLLQMLLLPSSSEMDVTKKLIAGIKDLNQEVNRAALSISRCVPFEGTTSSSSSGGGGVNRGAATAAHGPNWAHQLGGGGGYGSQNRIFYFNITPNTTLEQICLFFYSVEFMVNSVSARTFLAHYFPKYVTEAYADLYDPPEKIRRSHAGDGQRNACHAHFQRIFNQHQNQKASSRVDGGGGRRGRKAAPPTHQHQHQPPIMYHEENHLRALQQCILTNYYLHGLLLPDMAEMEVEPEPPSPAHVDLSSSPVRRGDGTSSPLHHHQHQHQHQDQSHQIQQSSPHHAAQHSRAIILLFNIHDASPRVSSGISRIMAERVPPLSEKECRQTLLQHLDSFIAATLKAQKQQAMVQQQQQQQTQHHRRASSGLLSQSMESHSRSMSTPTPSTTAHFRVNSFSGNPSLVAGTSATRHPHHHRISSSLSVHRTPSHGRTLSTDAVATNFLSHVSPRPPPHTHAQAAPQAQAAHTSIPRRTNNFSFASGATPMNQHLDTVMYHDHHHHHHHVTASSGGGGGGPAAAATNANHPVDDSIQFFFNKFCEDPMRQSRCCGTEAGVGAAEERERTSQQQPLRFSSLTILSFCDDSKVFSENSCHHSAQSSYADRGGEAGGDEAVGGEGEFQHQTTSTSAATETNCHVSGGIVPSLRSQFVISLPFPLLPAMKALTADRHNVQVSSPPTHYSDHGGVGRSQIEKTEIILRQQERSCQQNFNRIPSQLINWTVYEQLTLRPPVKTFSIDSSSASHVIQAVASPSHRKTVSGDRDTTDAAPPPPPLTLTDTVIEVINKYVYTACPPRRGNPSSFVQFSNAAGMSTGGIGGFPNTAHPYYRPCYRTGGGGVEAAAAPGVSKRLMSNMCVDVTHPYAADTDRCAPHAQVTSVVRPYNNSPDKIPGQQGQLSPPLSVNHRGRGGGGAGGSNRQRRSSTSGVVLPPPQNMDFFGAEDFDAVIPRDLLELEEGDDGFESSLSDRLTDGLLFHHLNLPRGLGVAMSTAKSLSRQAISGYDETSSSSEIGGSFLGGRSDFDDCDEDSSQWCNNGNDGIGGGGSMALWGAFTKGAGGAHVPRAAPLVLFQQRPREGNGTTRKSGRSSGGGLAEASAAVPSSRKSSSVYPDSDTDGKIKKISPPLATSMSRVLQLLPHYFSPFLWGGAGVPAPGGGGVPAPGGGGTSLPSYKNSGGSDEKTLAHLPGAGDMSSQRRDLLSKVRDFVQGLIIGPSYEDAGAGSNSKQQSASVLSNRRLQSPLRKQQSRAPSNSTTTAAATDEVKSNLNGSDRPNYSNRQRGAIESSSSASSSHSSSSLLFHLMHLPPPGLIPLDLFMLTGAVHFPAPHHRYLRQLISTCCIRVSGPLGAGGVACIDSAAFPGDIFSSDEQQRHHVIKDDRRRMTSTTSGGGPTAGTQTGASHQANRCVGEDVFSNGLLLSTRSMAQYTHFIAALTLLLSPYTPTVSMSYNKHSSASSQRQTDGGGSNGRPSTSNCHPQNISELIQMTDGTPSIAACSRTAADSSSYSLFASVARGGPSAAPRSSGRVLVQSDVITCTLPFLLAHKLGGCGTRRASAGHMANSGLSRNELYNLYLAHMRDMSIPVEGLVTSTDLRSPAGPADHNHLIAPAGELFNHFEGGLWDAAVASEATQQHRGVMGAENATDDCLFGANNANTHNNTHADLAFSASTTRGSSSNTEAASYSGFHTLLKSITSSSLPPL